MIFQSEETFMHPLLKSFKVLLELSLATTHIIKVIFGMLFTSIINSKKHNKLKPKKRSMKQKRILTICSNVRNSLEISSPPYFKVILEM